MKSDKKFFLTLTISLGSAIVMVCFAVLLTFMFTYTFMVNKFNRELATNQLNDKIIYKLSELDGRVRQSYIGEIDSQKIVDGVAYGYVAGLGDRYAEYMNAETYAEYIRENQGRMVGIGVNITISEEYGGVIEVTSVMPDSPAEAGGMLAGDYIYKVEGELISSIGYEEAVSRIKGEAGTVVNLTILRDVKEKESAPEKSEDPTDESEDTTEPATEEKKKEKEEVELSFTRAEVRTRSVDSRMITGDIGYIKISSFNRETPNEFIKAINELQSLGALKYIFDVRSNPGGDLDGVTTTLDYLLPEGPIIRYTYRNGKEEVRMSDENEITAPMAVLINEYTASAAELFCAALKDYEKAALIGVKTYGKGTMQGIYRLSDGVTALKITNAKYYPPFSDCYDGVGIYPHEEIRLPEGFIIGRGSEKDDTQLQAAIKALSEE